MVFFIKIPASTKSPLLGIIDIFSTSLLFLETDILFLVNHKKARKYINLGKTRTTVNFHLK
jgi:hypothetical protein